MCPVEGKGWTRSTRVQKKRSEVSIVIDVLQEDVVFNSPSLAAAFVTFSPANGWNWWKNKDGQSIDIYRQK